MPHLRRIHEPASSLAPFASWPETGATPCAGCHRLPPRRGAVRFVTLFAPLRVGGRLELCARPLCERCYGSSALRAAAARSGAATRRAVA